MRVRERERRKKNNRERERERERMLRTSYASACILIVERMCRIVKGKRDSKRWCGSQREERVER